MTHWTLIIIIITTGSTGNYIPSTSTINGIKTEQTCIKAGEKLSSKTNWWMTIITSCVESEPK